MLLTPTITTRRWPLAVLAAALLASLAANALLAPRALELQRLLAASWDPGLLAADTPGLYGAHVRLGPEAQPSVWLSVFVDRPTLWVRQQLPDRRLGQARTAEEAAQRWGELRWSAQGLHVGRGPDALLVPASELTRHR